MHPLFYLLFVVSNIQTAYALLLCVATLQQPPFHIPPSWTNQTLLYLLLSAVLCGYRLNQPFKNQKVRKAAHFFYLTVLATWLIAFGFLLNLAA